MESHILTCGSERTHMERQAPVGNRIPAFLDKRTGKVYPLFPPATDG